MPENEKTRLQKFMGGGKQGYQIAFQMAWPAVMESFFIALASMVDSLMVSSIGAYAVAAVGLTTQPKFIGLCLFIAMNVSVSALVARRRGEKDRTGANQVLLIAIIFTIVMGIVISAAAVIFAEPIIRFCGANEDTQESAVLYFRIIMGGMIFNIISMAINASQRGAGNTKIAMRTNVTSNVVNMIGNYLLIQGHLGFPAMGIAGAALATVFGTIVACIMSICSLIPKDNFVSIPYIIKERVRITLEPAKNMAKIASSVFIEQVFMRTGFLLVSIMAARLGTSAYAAHQVAMNVMKRPDLAVMYGTICQRIGNMISIVLSILYLTLGNWYFHLYFVEEDIIAMGARIMQVMTVIVLLQISQVIYMGCLRGAGDVVFTTCASTLSITIVRPSCAYLFCYVLEIGVVGIWLGIVCDQIVRVCLTNWRFKSGKWTKIKI